jgi:hypothetical protein
MPMRSLAAGEPAATTAPSPSWWWTGSGWARCTPAETSKALRAKLVGYLFTDGAFLAPPADLPLEVDGRKDPHHRSEIGARRWRYTYATAHVRAGSRVRCYYVLHKRSASNTTVKGRHQTNQISTRWGHPHAHPCTDKQNHTTHARQQHNKNKAQHTAHRPPRLLARRAERPCVPSACSARDLEQRLAHWHAGLRIPRQGMSGSDVLVCVLTHGPSCRG